MLILISGGEVFSPDYLGKKEILIAGGKIVAIEEMGKIKITGLEIKEINAEGKKIIPGFIDPHVHIIGGGGEGGPATRAPEITLSQIVMNGVTTVVGCLGTDGITRHMESLLAKAYALEEEGITTFIYTGSYQLPVKTITGSVCSDITLIEKVIGAGEIAVSDHRSSQPTFEQIVKLAAECRVGGMLGGKAGVLHLHIGDGERRLDFLFRLVKETEIPITQVFPTHVNRNPSLLEHAIQFAKKGGYINITAEESPPKGSSMLSTKEAIKYCLENDVPIDRITISSDSNGSLPRFDEKGNLIGLTIATQETLRKGFQTLVKEGVLDLSQAIKIFSTNLANYLKLKGKGEIKVGNDADILILDKNLEITDVFAKGKRMIGEGKLLVKGTFEE
jgi:beta-aspartyl-dipeptidase (metallo-type)